MIRQNGFDRALHRFALQSRWFRRFCFERECERNARAFDAARENLFVAGMARAGSTALQNALYASGAFSATTYASMPFVLAPSYARLLARLRRSPPAPVERAHGDGIEVGLDAPEALDAVFWTTFLPPAGDLLEPREVPGEVLRKYAMFIENLLLETGRERYLSKMNQGVDKLAALAAYFEDSVFLLPFRDPLQQAASLQRQHRRFSELSAYEQQYLGWLGHHEFGALHRRFDAGGQTAAADYAADDPNYWLQQWRETYSYLSRLADLYPNLTPVCYEHMANSKSFWSMLSQRLNAGVAGEGFVDCNRSDPVPRDAFDEALQRECRALYERLQRQSLTESDS